MARAPLAALAERQHGVVGRAQLGALGLSRSMVEGRIEAAILIRLHRGVYAVGHRHLRPQGRWLAAVLACGPDALLSHRDAAALHGLRASDRRLVDVTVPRRLRAGHRGIEIHHSTTLNDADRMVVDGIPVTSVARTLVDLAGVLPKDGVAKALREAEHLRCVDVRDLHDAMRRTRNRPGHGHAVLKAALEEHRRHGTQLTRSVLEERFLALCDVHGLPRPRMNFHIGRREVDACWPAQRLAVELDGWEHHKGRHAFQRDRTKANELVRAGWRVLRFTHDDVVRRPGDTVETINAFLADA